MQDARREALAARLHKERMSLWDQDLNRVTAYFDGTTVQAALLLGFAFTAYTGAADGIQELKFNGDEHEEAYDPMKHTENWEAAMFYISGAVTVGAFTYVICMGQLATILGPLLALKGPDGSMERALVKMKDERMLLFQMFSVGLVGYYGMLLSLTWLNISLRWIEILCTVVLTLFFILIVMRAMTMFKSFSYHGAPLKQIVQASSDVNQAFGVGQTLGSSSNGPMQGGDYLRSQDDGTTPLMHVAAG